MTKEEIKEAYSLCDILSRYSLYPNRSGFICCPFHKEKTPSMKVYKKSFHCFGCGANGDIFTFVMKMEDTNFKSAFALLGGTYKEQNTFQEKLAVYKAKKRQETRQRQLQRIKKEEELNQMLINIYQRYVNNAAPLSDVWGDSYNALQYQLYRQEVLCEMREQYGTK